jgi:transcriptional regulator EpsA
MDDLTQLTSREQVAFWRAIESSLAIKSKGQFFLWVQGQLQALLPHDVMVCVRFDATGRAEYIECLQGVPLAQPVLEALTNAADGLIVKIAHRCRSANLSLVQVDECASEAHPLHPLLADLKALGLLNAIFHDTGELVSASSFFAVLRIKESPSERHAMVLRALLPNLALAFARAEVQRKTSDADGMDDDLDSDLTDRQVEILHWVKLGKTNSEIAIILGISALTVKNHMQKLFKKLNVHNRAQAVAKVMTMQLATRQTVE